MVTTCHGMNLPLFFKAVVAARSRPPQQGTSMRTMVRLRMLVAAKDLRELFGVVHVVQLGTADQRNAAPQEILMEAAIGIGGAVRRDQQMHVRRNRAR